MCINDLHNATNHFADDTNFLYSSKSLKDINKKTNFDLKNITHWLRANKISLNTGKTEMVLFKTNKIEMEKQRSQLFKFKARPTSDIQTTHSYNKA